MWVRSAKGNFSKALPTEKPPALKSLSLKPHVPADRHGLFPGQLHKARNDVDRFLAVAVGQLVVYHIERVLLPLSSSSSERMTGPSVLRSSSLLNISRSRS